jgi:hypothetical protein
MRSVAILRRGDHGENSSHQRTNRTVPAFVSRRHWPKPFSFRTLLIATTLVAVLLGLVVWAAGK